MLRATRSAPNPCSVPLKAPTHRHEIPSALCHTDNQSSGLLYLAAKPRQEKFDRVISMIQLSRPCRLTDTGLCSGASFRPGCGNQGTRLTGLEGAIVSEGKLFISSAPCQKLVEALYRGDVVQRASPSLYKYSRAVSSARYSLYSSLTDVLCRRSRLSVSSFGLIMELRRYFVLIVPYVATMQQSNRSMLHI